MLRLSVTAVIGIYPPAYFPIELGSRRSSKAFGIFLAVVSVLITSNGYALDALSLDAAAINAGGWKLEGVRIAITELDAGRQQLQLSINRLDLPKPFDDLHLADIRCTAFSWKDNEILCERGRAQMRSRQWHSPTAGFSFRISEKHSSFKITDLQLLGGRIDVDGEERGRLWRLHANARNLDSRLVQKQLAQELFELKDGKIGFDLRVSGSSALIKDFVLTAGLEGLTVQSKDGKIAAEALSLSFGLNAQNQNGLWQWRSHSRFTGGGLYLEPVYLEAGDEAVTLDAEGDWNGKTKLAEIRSVIYRHAKAGALAGNATVQFGDEVGIARADIALHSDNLKDFSVIYLKPFFEQTAFEGIALEGKLNADFSIVQQSLTKLSVVFNQLAVNDDAGRVAVFGGDGEINWSDDETFDKPSKLAWRQLRLRALPVGPARVSFLSRADSVRLLEKTRLPFLGGAVAVNKFNWRAQAGQEPDVYFEGGLSNVSLEQLSKALNWTPLSGTISGRIPGVEYRDKTLKLGGELIIRVFDGVVKITDLASSGLFSDFPRLYSEIEIDNLDLDQLTGKFKFGGITGKLSGFIRKLALENWKPVSFYAWLGTPDDDDSRHRISQKAVKNIASIGGGGATDLVSRSILSMFETFGYDKIGLGCYLHNGVCQLMGVEAAKQGYYIIKGGGLPRIDVIGYNSQVDWDVLIERLKRITATDEVIIE